MNIVSIFFFIIGGLVIAFFLYLIWGQIQYEKEAKIIRRESGQEINLDEYEQKIS